MRVECRTTPFGTAIETGKDDDAALGGSREHAGTELTEARQDRGVGFRRPPRQHVLGETLPRERRRLERLGLRFGELLAFDFRRRHLAVAEREERRACLPVEHVHVAELRDLRDGVDVTAIAFHGDQVRRGGEVQSPRRRA